MSSSPTTYSRTTTFSTLIYLLKTLYLIPFKVSERPWKLADDVPVVIAVSEKRSHAGHLFTSVFFIQNTVLPCRQSFDVLQRAKSVSAQWFRQRDCAHWFVVRSLTAHSGLQCGVRLCAIVCTLQCGVRICAVVCSAESDSTQWFAVWSPTLRSGFFLPCWVWLCAVDYNVETQRSGLQCGVQLLALLSRGPNDTFYYL